MEVCRDGEKKVKVAASKASVGGILIKEELVV
jgi:hypothetical protein